MPKTSLPWAVVVSMIPLVSDCTRRLTLPGCRPDRGSSGRCSHRDRDRRHRFFRMAAGVQGTGDAQHVRPMGLDPERERGEVGGALPTGRRVRSRGKFFSHQGSGPKAPYRYTATAAFSHLRDDAATPWQGKNFHFTGANFSGGQVSPDDAAAYATSFVAAGSGLPLDAFVADILATDGAARAGLIGSIGTGRFADEVSIAAGLTVPIAVLHGSGEQLVSLEYLEGLALPTLWRGRIQVIEGAGHAPQEENPDVLSKMLSEFLAELAQR